MKTNQPKLWKIDMQGNLFFNLKRRFNYPTYISDSYIEHSFIMLLIMLLCIFVDASSFYQLFSSFLYDSPLVRTTTLLGFLVAFDIGPIILGVQYRKFKQGFNVDKACCYLLIIVFIIAALANFFLRVVMKDLVLPDMTSYLTSMVNNPTAESTDNEYAYAWAIIASLIPLFTSFVSFGVSFASSNPLKARMLKYKKEEAKLKEYLTQIDALINEYSNYDEFIESLRNDENTKKDLEIRLIVEKAITYAIYVRNWLKTHTEDPIGISLLSLDDFSENLSKEIRKEL